MMLRLGKESKLSPAKVLDKAVEFFGPGGLGLEVKDRDACCATFEGGGGFVSVQVSEKGKGTEVDLETREWDYQARQFVARI